MKRRRLEKGCEGSLGKKEEKGFRLEVGDYHFGGPASDVYAPSPSGFTPSEFSQENKKTLRLEKGT